jgi:hypothetical protein
MTNEAPTLPPQPIESEPLPDQYMIPAQLLEQWIEIKTDEYLYFKITRLDVDKLLFALSSIVRSQQTPQEWVIHWSNGRTQEANLEMSKSRISALHSQNDIRQFIANLMVSAISGRNKNG